MPRNESGSRPEGGRTQTSARVWTKCHGLAEPMGGHGDGPSREEGPSCGGLSG